MASPSESQLHERIRALSASALRVFPGIVVGPGDDCAVLRSPRGDDLLITVDQLVEGRHYFSGTPIDLIARKAVARSISDIAAMGGSPSWGLATALLPHECPYAEELTDALHRWGQHFGAPLVGGDIATWGEPKNPAEAQPLVLTTTVIGAPAPGRGPVTRSGARVGDEVWVTGALGGSLASGRHLTFEPRVREGRFLADLLVSDLHAMIDVSDGLGRDAGRVARASSVGIELDASAVPLHPDAGDVLSAIRAGEDYELVFTCSPGVLADALTRVRPAGPLAPFTRIGRVVPQTQAGSSCVLVLPDGRRVDASDLGFEHT